MKKSLHYAYPTSPLANRYGWPYGAWFIEVNNKMFEVYPNYRDRLDCNNRLIDRRWEALNAFEHLDYPIDKYTSFTRDSLPFQQHGNF